MRKEEARKWRGKKDKGTGKKLEEELRGRSRGGGEAERKEATERGIAGTCDRGGD